MSFLRKLRRKSIQRPMVRSDTLRILDDMSSRVAAGIGDKPVSCKAGCGACCYNKVEASYLEATEAVREAKRVGYVIPEKRLALHKRMAHDGKVDPMLWRTYNVPCVFLTEHNRCAVHAARPLVCRSLVVRSNPRTCGVPDGRIEKYNTNWDAERAYTSIRAQHIHRGLTPVYAPLGLLVSAVLEGRSPEEVAIEEGADGLAKHNPDDKRANHSARLGAHAAGAPSLSGTD